MRSKMTTPVPDDDLSPEQRNALPRPAEVADRQWRQDSGRGRLGRLRSWLTVLVALLAVIACYFLVQSTY
jgi:hypothetical protein